MFHNLRTIYVLYNRREISTYKNKHEIIIAPEKASHKHRGISRGNLLKQFLGVGKKFSTTYPIVSFFSPDLFRKISNFSIFSSHFSTFWIFAKTVHTIRTKISTVIFYTIVWSMCAISINSYNWDWSQSEGKRPKPTPLPHMRLWVFFFLSVVDLK